MRSKYKMTGFARFLIFLMIFTPMAYIGASYYNGEDGLEKVKTFIEEKFQKSEKAEPASDVKILNLSKDEIIERQQAEIQDLREKVERLEKLVGELQESIQ